MPSDSGAAWSPPASNNERRLSNSSDGSAGSGYSKALSTDSADFLATRPHTASVLPGRPAANPLQFVKVGPAHLGKNARELLRKSELAQKTDKLKIETQEDWQSNLDNWKSSRRKRVEHIIERCVEVKRMENEPSQPRAKSKTFNEMLEERAGRRRRGPLPLYTDDEGHDLSDLGIGTSSTKSSLSEDCDAHSLASDGMDLDKNHSDIDNMSHCDIASRKLESSTNDYDTCTTNTISSPEPEEYTYEGAIEGYKSRIISQTNSNIVKTVVTKETSPDKTNGDLNRIRTSVSNKIEEKVSSFQRDRVNNDIKNNNQKKDLPKVDIHKRREQFERENSLEPFTNKPKLPDIANKTSIKERLSSLEKFNELSQIQKSTSDLAKLPAEGKPLKERLSSLEKNKSNSDIVKRLSNGDLSKTMSVKERLTSFHSQVSEEEIKIIKTEVKEVSVSLKERLSNLDAAKNKEIPKISVIKEIVNIKNETKDLSENESNAMLHESSLKSNLSGIENQMQSFCRSLDSLDINGQTSPSSFERVQSLEDFDCSEIQNNTVPSDIETEDSGIHTARDSCAPADDIADLTQVASPVGEPMAEVYDYESSNEDTALALDPIMEVLPSKTIEPVIPAELIENAIPEAIIEEPDEQDHELSKTEDSDSASNYLQATSQPIEDFSATDEITEIKLDKDDEDTLKSLDNQDTSVIDALDLAFKEIDSEDSFDDKTDSTVKEAPRCKGDNKIAPLYENIDVFYENGGVVDGSAFPLDLPANILEPPKEKPPPPPVDDPDDELLGNGNFKHTSSARRIKKEIRNKRSSFLGIEGGDDSYLDADLALAPRPDITLFLQEETKIEKLLYKKSLGHDLDSKLRESRDSGVDVDRGPSVDNWYNRHSSPDDSNPHSRQNSEPYTNVTVTSDEEEQAKRSIQSFSCNLSSKLTNIQSTEDQKMLNLDQKIQEQQSPETNLDCPDGLIDDAHSKEVLRFERELLQLEQEELRRQREKLRENQTRIIQQSNEHNHTNIQIAKHNPYRHSMPNLISNETYTPNERNEKRKPFVSEDHMQKQLGVEECRKMLYENDDRHVKHNGDGMKHSAETIHLYENGVKRHVQSALIKPPQPILPPKPKSRESVEREITMRSSRVPSAVEYVNVDKTAVQLRSKNNQYHPMTRHTLQALSAAPASKLITSSDWMQARSRKPANYNQHWLVQEAEQRRIEEQRSRMRSSAPGQRHSYHDGLHNIAGTRHLSSSHQHLPQDYSSKPNQGAQPTARDTILSVSGKRKCSHCGDELGRGAAMIIESLSLCYHVWCFTCAVCGTALGDGRAGADVRVRAGRLHCHHCYSGDDGRKYSCV